MSLIPSALDHLQSWSLWACVNMEQSHCRSSLDTSVNVCVCFLQDEMRQSGCFSQYFSDALSWRLVQAVPQPPQRQPQGRWMIDEWDTVWIVKVCVCIHEHFKTREIFYLLNQLEIVLFWSSAPLEKMQKSIFKRGKDKFIIFCFLWLSHLGWPVPTLCLGGLCLKTWKWKFSLDHWEPCMMSYHQIIQLLTQWQSSSDPLHRPFPHEIFNHLKKNNISTTTLSVYEWQVSLH